MKSLVEEASTIAKAIEKAWIAAGKPQSFSIKIFEHPETNFLGFVKKSAKIGIFFEPVIAPVKQADKPSYSRQSSQRSSSPRQHHNQRQERSTDQSPSASTRNTRSSHAPRQSDRQDRTSQRSTESAPREREREVREPREMRERPSNSSNRQRNAQFREKTAYQDRDRSSQGHQGGYQQNNRSQDYQDEQPVREQVRDHMPQQQASERAHHVEQVVEKQPLTVQVTPIAITKAPIKKALKVSSRRYSSQKAVTADTQNSDSDDHKNN